MSNQSSLFWLVISLSIVGMFITGCNLGNTRPAQPTPAASDTPFPTWTPRPTRTPDDAVPTPLFTNPTRNVPPTAQIPPTATPDPTQPRLLQNGSGITNGEPMNNGEFQVEGYCTSFNVGWGVDADTTNWYCTENGRRVRTLDQADFDTICQRTYNNLTAYAAQTGSDSRPAYRWRCYGFPQ